MIATPLHRFAALAVALGLLGLAQPAAAAETCRGKHTRPRIVGGAPADIKDWPGQAALRIHNPDRAESGYFCGATAIAPEWLLTAAHCFGGEILEGPETGRMQNYFEREADGRYASKMEYLGLHQTVGFSGKAYLQVVIGVSDLAKAGPENVRDVTEIIVHADYRDPAKTGNDIALVKLARPWTGPLARIQLDAAGLALAPDTGYARVAGFGNLTGDAAPRKFVEGKSGAFAAGSDILMQVDVPLVGEAQCKARFPDDTVGAGQLCAGYEEGLKDSCQGDSGGPIVRHDEDGCPIQVGIVSWGEGCAEPKAYGVYARVAHHADWIRTRVRELDAAGKAAARSKN